MLLYSSVYKHLKLRVFMFLLASNEGGLLHAASPYFCCSPEETNQTLTLKRVFYLITTYDDLSLLKEVVRCPVCLQSAATL